MARGSRTFSFAARALPARVRDRFVAYYAFCRVSDDAVDRSDDPRAALVALRRRVDRAAAGCPEDEPVDRALAWLVHAHGLPRAPLEALLEGYLWDVEARVHPTLSSTIAYAARVAGSVGVAATILMGVRERQVLARAADLGVAMQLTNVARDVGEDARRGRLYLPEAWLRQEGIEPAQWLAKPVFSPGIGRVVRRLLDHALVLYARAERGIAKLPADCRVAIRAASWMYADIERVIRAHGCDSVTRRAYTSRARKALALVRAIGREARGVRAQPCDDGPLPETAFLLEGT